MADDLEAHLEGLGRNFRNHYDKLLERIPRIVPLYDGSPGDKHSEIVGYTGGFPTDEHHIEIVARQDGRWYHATITICQHGRDDKAWTPPNPADLFKELERRYRRQKEAFEEASKASQS